METLLPVFRQYDQLTIALILTLPRMYAFLATSQLLNSSAVPGMARIACIISLSFMAVPMNMEIAAEFDRSISGYAFIFVKEYAIGFVLGYIVSWIFWVVECAGSLIDNQRGAGIASSIDPLQGHESSPLGNMFSLAFLTYIFATASVLPVLGMLYKSFALWPVMKSLPIISEDFPKIVLGIFDYAMQLGFNLAAPIVAVMFMAEFSLAMVSRFAPQIQVFVLAMPIKSLLAIFMLIFYFKVMFPFVDQQVGRVPPLADSMFNLLKFGEDLLQHGVTPTNPGGPR